MRWSLNELYPSFESEAFKMDMEKCNALIPELIEWVKGEFQNTEKPKEKIGKLHKKATRILKFIFEANKLFSPHLQCRC